MSAHSPDLFSQNPVQYQAFKIYNLRKIATLPSTVSMQLPDLIEF